MIKKKEKERERGGNCVEMWVDVKRGKVRGVGLKEGVVRVRLKWMKRLNWNWREI